MLVFDEHFHSVAFVSCTPLLALHWDRPQLVERVGGTNTQNNDACGRLLIVYASKRTSLIVFAAFTMPLAGARTMSCKKRAIHFGRVLDMMT